MSQIKKHDNLFVFLITFLITIGITLSIKLISGDELWNFNNIYKMYNGYQLYTEINVIVTPIFFYIANIVFKIFGANLFIFRLFGVFIYCCLNVLIYVILKALHIDKKHSLLYLFVIQAFIIVMIRAGANYNLLSMVFVLLGIFLCLKNRTHFRWFYFSQGVIIYLVLFTKQNVGIFYSLAIIICELWLYGINKKNLINILKQVVTTFILASVTLFYLFINNQLYDFINYTILGISEFTNNFIINIYAVILIAIDILIIVVPMLLSKKKILTEEQQYNLVILCVMSLLLSFVIYPLINIYHIKLALIIPLITLLYILHFSIIKDFLVNQILNITIISIFLILLISSCYHCIQWIIKAKFDFGYSHPYFATLVDKEVEEKINVIENYINEQKQKGKEVIVLSEESALYMIPLKENKGDMDLPFLGNMGKDGENGLIEKISKLENSIILIKKEEIFLQESKKANDFIKEHYSKIGEIEDFCIYEVSSIV